VWGLEVDDCGGKTVFLLALVREEIAQAGAFLDAAYSLRRAKMVRDSLDKGSFSGIA